MDVPNAGGDAGDDGFDLEEVQALSGFFKETGLENGEEFSVGDTTGKADDAVDYEDFSDDDLPPDDGPIRQGVAGGSTGGGVDDANPLADIMMEGDDEGLVNLDDLFGDEMEDIQMDGQDGGLPSDQDYGLDAAAMGMNGDGLDQNLFRSVDYGLPEMPDIPAPELSPEEQAQIFFPDFVPHARPSFSSLFRPKSGYLPSQLVKVPKVLVPTKLHVESAPDDAVLFAKATGHKSSSVEKKGIVIIHHDEGRVDRGQSRAGHDEKMDPELERDIEIACDDWESKLEAMMSPPPTPVHEPLRSDSASGDDIEEIDRRPAKRLKTSDHDLRYLDSLPNDWLDEEAIYGGDLSELASKAIIDLNDPYLLIDVRNPNEIRRTRRIGGEFKRRVNRDLTQRYNISNDEAYELLKENHQNKVRSTIGQLNIEHSMPALRLQSPFYKVKLSTKECRSFHRPNLHHLPIEHPIRFQKMKVRKKKTYRGKEIKEVLATTKDVSLSDGMDFVLLEYSEEYPTVMSNFGMGSRLINYYRRTGPDDEKRPKYEIGETQVLMSQDRSPFWNFGTVDPGETVFTLYNKMVRAPIFKHTPKSTDFLVIRNRQGGSETFYLRTIPWMFVVGQLLPVTEVPGPHSRKVTTASKNRLKMICYRVVRRKPEHALAVKDISVHFPDSTDMQNRQKMKEFMHFNKNTGVWEMKPGEAIPEEASIRSMVKPEDLCLLEAMQVGLRNLEDAGYGKSVDDDEGDENQATSLEQQLAPWNATKNFLNATQGKAMLQLHGEGDPSGRGEAFSFVRTSMKGGFKDVGESIDEKMDKQRLKELGGHSYNVARQQKMYEEAIDRIWRSQERSLSSAEEIHDGDIDMDRDDNGDDLFDDRAAATPHSEAPSPWVGDFDETTSQFSKMSAKSQRNKVLRITRKYRDEHGRVENRTEIVRDPKVIRQYQQKRREHEAEKTQIENLVPTGNDEEDLANRKRIVLELARLQRNKERREARERQGGRGGRQMSTGDAMSPEATTPGSPAAFPLGSGGAKPVTSRKCANCGLTGHIRTNKRQCPMLNGKWKEMGLPAPPDFQASGPGSPSAA